MNDKNEKKVDYIQMSLAMFRKMFPELAAKFPPVIQLTNDSKYIVKLYPDRGAVEVGYPEDVWLNG